MGVFPWGLASHGQSKAFNLVVSFECRKSIRYIVIPLCTIQTCISIPLWINAKMVAIKIQHNGKCPCTVLATLLRLNVPHNVPYSWKPQLKVVVFALLFYKEENISAPIWAGVLCDSIKRCLWIGSCDICICLEKVMSGFILISSQLCGFCYFKPPFLRLHVISQEIKQVVESGEIHCLGQ